MDGKSLTPEQEKLNALKQVLPEVFAEGKVDWEKLKATLGSAINFSNERYVLNWAGKSEAFKVLQAPTTKTLVPAKDESVNFDDTEHIFIEGENLEVLKVLQKSYFGKVKMIYIDPPYNTGNDSFIYPDKFSETKAEYEKRVGDKDEEGYMTKSSIKLPSSGGVPQAGWSKNSKENGQYHSNWLNMMMPRLYLAKNLLKQDGVIFISIDDNEVHNLRLLMNEIFGEENFVAEIVWERSYAPINMVKHFSKSHDYVLCFAKNIDFLKCFGLPRPKSTNSKYINPDNDPRGLWRTDNLSVGPVVESKVYEIITPAGRKCWPPKGRCWLYSKERYKEMVADNRIWFGKDGSNIPAPKRFLNEVKQGLTPMTIWKHKDVGHNQDSMRELRDLFEGEKIFDYSKPVKLIKQISQLYTSNDDLILDFFSGSGTTAHAVMALNAEDGGNRKCISVQLPEKCDEKSEAYKAGYETIADIAKERIRRAASKINDDLRLRIEDLNKKIDDLELKIEELKGQLPTEEQKSEIENLQSEILNHKSKIQNLQSQDLGFKVLKLSDSNFKQWQQFPSAGGVSEGRGGKEEQTKALEEQIKLFVDPVAENATTENMVYELLLKSGKDLNSTIAKKFPSYGGVAESRGGKKRNSENYFTLPYNPKLKERARALRKAGNLSEVLFWNQVKNKQFKGYDFDRQKIIGNYIVDFYCTNCNVVIEIDGSSHDDKVEYDSERDLYLESLGLVVIHIPVADVMKNMNGVMQMLYDHPALAGTPPKEGNGFYTINETELVLILEKANQELINAVIASKPQKVIALDKLFKGNDQLKTNASLQMRDAGIEFKTI